MIVLPLMLDRTLYLEPSVRAAQSILDGGVFAHFSHVLRPTQ